MKRYTCLILLTLLSLLLLSSCVKQDVKQYLDLAQPLMEEYNDTFNRALNTSRLALSPVIDDLQTIRHLWNDIEPPKPAEDLHDNFALAMEYGIDWFMALVADEDQDVIDEKFRYFEIHIGTATDVLLELVAKYK